MVSLLVDASAISKSQTSVPAKKSRKMQIRKAQNGCNLCAREWLTCNKTGSAAELKAYYDGLSDGEKKSYDKLAAKKLVNGPISDTTLLPTQLLATSLPPCIILIILAQGSLSATVQVSLQLLMISLPLGIRQGTAAYE
ncbi:uncharacterized protein BJ212DRAFT_1489680 [Suillus subaureus]|uniref:Uncharacterized protein n=1 Tax=Suillus subaureus TaxID=48587 RepID=A0A9P7DJH1_9AGAM|nr:uncharacterized protein BJ212DRAFT_1489680 [Suillus subaureus]KAG1795575.1 hypothetical protein BJ212DRAFT_1489680 [Suillus subaureus]